MDLEQNKQEILEQGFTIIDKIYSGSEVEALIKLIDLVDTSSSTFRKSANLFAIRQFIKEIPEVAEIIFSKRLKSVISESLGEDYFVTKSIYFDKPEESNWFVAYHQDLTISVDKRIDSADFGPWTVKQNQFAVQPPIEILESNFTIRLHLDSTDETNGALKVIPNSHRKQIYRPEKIDWTVEDEVSCNVGRGGIMIMRPLLLHSSGRSTENKKRRVIHIEFGKHQLPKELQWSEYLNYDRVNSK